jgi:hypothetical protein
LILGSRAVGKANETTVRRNPAGGNHNKLLLAWNACCALNT